MQFLDWVTPEAKAIGAVNTIVARGDAWHGFNTDVVGFTHSLVEVMGALGGLSCAVVGSGGAARAIIWALRNLGAITTVYSRSESKGKAIAEEFAATWSSLDGAMFGSYDVVINATPLGTRGSLEHQSVARSKQLRGARLVYDLVYNPEETALLREAHDAGCATLGGLSMLVTQAAAQFKLWTGTNPPEDVMRKAVQEAMQNV
jgi:shikimate dehydrogenase